MSSKPFLKKIITLVALVFSSSYTGIAFSAETVSVDDPRTQKKVDIVIHTYLRNEPSPTILLGHGCSGILRFDYDWAKEINDWGYNVLIVDSYGPRGLKQDCDSQVPNKLVNSEQRTADAFAVARWAKSQPWNKGKVGYIGFSNGGWTALTMSNSVGGEVISGIVAYYPACYPNEYPNLKVPTQIHIGDKDDWTPSIECEPYRKLKVVDLNIYKGATHGFDRRLPPRVYLGHSLMYDDEATNTSKQKAKEFFQKYISN